MLSRVIAKNVGDVFLRHSVHYIMYTHVFLSPKYVYTRILSSDRMCGTTCYRLTFASVSLCNFVNTNSAGRDAG